MAEPIIMTNGKSEVKVPAANKQTMLNRGWEVKQPVPAPTPILEQATEEDSTDAES